MALKKAERLLFARKVLDVLAEIEGELKKEDVDVRPKMERLGRLIAKAEQAAARRDLIRVRSRTAVDEADEAVTEAYGFGSSVLLMCEGGLNLSSALSKRLRRLRRMWIASHRNGKSGGAANGNGNGTPQPTNAQTSDGIRPAA